MKNKQYSPHPQVYAYQQQMAAGLADLATLRDKRVRAARAFHRGTLTPALVAASAALARAADVLTAMGVDVITKVRVPSCYHQLFRSYFHQFYFGLFKVLLYQGSIN